MTDQQLAVPALIPAFQGVIQVEANSKVPASKTAAQYAAVAAIFYSLGKGWVPPDQAISLVPILVGAFIGGWGTFKSWLHNEEKKTMEPFAPNAALKDTVPVLNLTQLAPPPPGPPPPPAAPVEAPAS